MIKLLRVENLILIESAQIPFEMGLNILSGETGAGKSAIMQGLRLIAGEKGDPKLIRHGENKAIVEALFEPPLTSPIWHFLENSGITVEKNEPLVIRRELPLNGKSRAFINHQLASLTLLKDLGENLFDIASQHGSQKLSSESFQKTTLDTWGDLNEEVAFFTRSWNEECQLKEELQTLELGESTRLRECEAKSREIEEIEQANLDPNEEETLFQEYSDLATGEERYSLANDAIQGLSSLSLNSIKQSLSKLSELDTSVTPLLELLTQAKIELDEVSWSIDNYQSKIACSPERMGDLNDRLKLLSRLKKKYGPTIPAILEWLDEQKAYLETLSSSEERIESIQAILVDLSPQNNILAEKLTAKRKKQASLLSGLITKELHGLNMNKAEFQIEVAKGERSKRGDDKITFLFQPNVGGKMLSVKEAASGGELARILLAIKTLLAEKAEPACLVFDEVDANIGGETARLLGEKLAILGKTTQVIAITHFPQVAAHATHHLAVKKKEVGGKTISTIEILSSETRQNELVRMVGGT